MKRNLIVEMLKLSIVVGFAVVVLILVTGCAAGTPMTQVKYEQLMQHCRNVGGAWYHYGGTQGRCDYDPLYQQR